MTIRQFRVIFKDKKLFVSTAFMLFGLFAFGFYIFKDKVKTKSDLVEIDVKLKHYDFHTYGIKNDSYRYNLYFDEYKNRFQIVADFIDYFRQELFERTVNNGDTLRIFISRNDYENIMNQDKVELFGIYGKKKTYLEFENSIERHNNETPLYIGLIFIVVGGIIFYLNSDKLRRIERIN